MGFLFIKLSRPFFRQLIWSYIFSYFGLPIRASWFHFVVRRIRHLPWMSPPSVGDTGPYSRGRGMDRPSCNNPGIAGRHLPPRKDQTTILFINQTSSDCGLWVERSCPGLFHLLPRLRLPTFAAKNNAILKAWGSERFTWFGCIPVLRLTFVPPEEDQRSCHHLSSSFFAGLSFPRYVCLPIVLESSWFHGRRNLCFAIPIGPHGLQTIESQIPPLPPVNLHLPFSAPESIVLNLPVSDENTTTSHTGAALLVQNW